MNKTNYIILTIVLYSSLAFVAYPLSFTSAYMTENGGTTDDTTGVVIITTPDSPLVYEGPVDPEGDLVFGASTNYTLTPVDLGNLGPSEPVTLVVTGGGTTGGTSDGSGGGDEWHCYVCSGSNCVIQTFKKVCQDACKPNTADCGTTGGTTGGSSQSQYRCMQCRCH